MTYIKPLKTWKKKMSDLEKQAFIPSGVITHKADSKLHTR